MWDLIAIVIIIVLVYLFTRPREGILIKLADVGAVDRGYPLNRCYNGVPELGDLPADMWIPGANTFPQPQTVYTFEKELPGQSDPSPRGSTYVRLIYSECSKYHPIVALFDNAIKEFSQRAELRQFVFIKDKIDNCGSYGEYSLPVVIKYYSPLNRAQCLPLSSVPKNPLIYRKTPEYGALADFILNDSLLSL